MSRHRNFRGRQYSYDYDDDYYDDDYYDEEEDENYAEQERLRAERAREEANMLAFHTKPAPTPTPTPDEPTIPKEVSKQQVHINEGDVVTLVNMGFAPAQCRDALLKYDHHVERALDFLLNNEQQSQQTTTQTVSQTKPPVAPPTTRPIDVDLKPPTSSMKQVSISIGSINKKAVSGGGAKRSKDVSVPRNKPKSIQEPVVKAPKIQEPVHEKRDASKRSYSNAKTLTSRSRLSMVVLGHVDAGKSTLMGQLLLKLGHVEKRIITKFQKQAAVIGKSSFALAWVMDTDESERERGVTMEVGTRLAKTKNHDVVILDAPGHKDFIPAMIHGAACADVGLLVVSAAIGEFEAGFDAPNVNNPMGHGKVGQTREHIVLSRGLGVNQLLVAINKLDSTEPAWSQSRFQHIKDTILPFILKSGFNAKRVRFVPVSGLTGENMGNDNDSANRTSSINKSAAAQTNSNAQLKKWYSGPTLIDAIDKFTPAQRHVDKPLRFIVVDVFSEGKGVTASGRVAQGTLRVGETVAVQPLGDHAAVSRIEHGSASSASPYGLGSSNIIDEVEVEDRSKIAVAGDSADVVLTGIDVARVSPGSVLCHESDPVPIKKKIRAKILVMENLSVPIIRGAQVSLHMHSVDVPASISKLISRENSKTPHVKPRVLSGGMNATVEITISERLCLEEYSVCRALGRFVVRRSGETIAVGVVEELLR